MAHQFRRRNFMTLAGAAGSTFIANRLAVFNWASPAKAYEKNWHHGVSVFGDLRYPPGFDQFDYVNAKTPKGGKVRQAALGTFNNFNVVVAGLKGSLAAGIDFIYETLLVRSLDEVSSDYGLLAEAISYPPDYSSVSYRLRPEAKWHDGVPVTPEDVIFSFEAFKTNNPLQSARYRQITKVDKTSDHEVTFVFDGSGSRGLMRILGQFTVLPKHWWESVDREGKKRDIGATMIEPPLGSGPYRIKEFTIGRNIVFERVSDYWGSTINVNVGRNNFDELRYDYFRDTSVALLAFKANTIDWRIENSARNWAAGYHFAAVRDKRVVLEEFPTRDTAIMQGFAFNSRRKKFQDPRVRLAFNYAFDFEKMNKQIFYGQYKRIDSYFEGTELAATGLPAGRELELLEMMRDKVPSEVFTTAYSNPISDSPEATRNNLRHAMRLLREAGYEVRNQHLVNSETNEPFTVECLAADASFERVFLFYSRSLHRLGINTRVRTVDQAQYQNRLRNWDFDIITAAWGLSLSPGEELRGYWGSQAAEQPSSLNLIGIKNPAVDNLIGKIIAADTQADLEAAAKALDRVLLWNHYVVPQWTQTTVRTARWDRFGRPILMPKYGKAAFPSLWWWDAEKAARTE